MTPRVLRPVAVVLVVTLVALVAGGVPAEAKRDEKAGRGGRLLGIVRDVEGRPAAGLSVVLLPLQANTTDPIRTTTGSAGTFEIRPVPTGLYEIGFVRDGQAFPANRLVLIPPGKKVEATYVIGPFQSQDETQGLVPGQQFAGLDAPAVGVARLDEKLGPTGWAWLRTGKGVAVLVGASALLVGAVIFLTGDDDSPTPVTPTTTAATGTP